jgi:hypothetical protein
MSSLVYHSWRIFVLCGVLLFALYLAIGAAPSESSKAQAASLTQTGVTAEAARSTPELIESAFTQGEISAEERLRYLIYAIYAPEKLPARFLGGVRWDATAYVEEIDAALAVQSSTFSSELGELLAQAGACDRPGNFANQIDSAHFHIEYTNIRGTLTITDYVNTLETAYQHHVDLYEWVQALPGAR